MKEKPILFSTPMVQALLNTRPNAWPAEPIDPGKPFKSQTRRVMKPQPEPERGGESEFDSQFWSWKDCQWIEGGLGFPESGIGDYAPYKVGDALWVRETWLKVPWTYDKSGVESYKYFYRSDGEIRDQTDLEEEFDKWRPSIFMPRKAARLFLEVKSVRVERLQDISPDDCHSEGAVKFPATCIVDMNRRGDEFIRDFVKLWDSLNAKRGYSWEGNPWVWVYKFMRVEGGLSV